MFQKDAVCIGKEILTGRELPGSELDIWRNVGEEIHTGRKEVPRSDNCTPWEVPSSDTCSLQDTRSELEVRRDIGEEIHTL